MDQVDQWDKVYSTKNMAQYPDNMLIRFVARHYYNVPDRKGIKFLDVGAGVGASTWYLSREGFSVAAIDKSRVAIQKLRERLTNEGLEAFIGCGDISKLEFKSDYFDAIIDISSLCYIDYESIAGVMKNLHKVLKPGGKFFSITPTDTCAEAPFNHTIDGVNLNARFQGWNDARRNFNDFKKVVMNTCGYDVGNGESWQRINLWVIEATK
jgi:2-polyprenyl-3-methyl-5-hydroxy-6-metoxy-1,4-benzoquinol methylase